MKLGLTKAFKRLEPDDGKLSSPVLRGRRRWQHLFCYPTLVLLLCSVTPIQAQEKGTLKPDLQKVYQDALTWSKTKLESMPTAQASADIAKGETNSNSKVCQGGKTNPTEALPIISGCKKKTQQEINETLNEEMTPEQGNQEAEDKILVFVSFSMPKQSLVALSQSAEKHHAVLVMRGLKDDSFKATQAAFADLGKEVQSGIEINPGAFEIYQIKQVPVFVRVKSTPGKGIQELGRLSGNVSLAFAANKLRELS